MMESSTFTNRTLVRFLGTKEKAGIGIITKVHQPFLKKHFTYSGFLFLPDFRIENSSTIYISGTQFGLFEKYKHDELFAKCTTVPIKALQMLQDAKMTSNTLIGAIGKPKTHPDHISTDGTFIILDDVDNILSGLRLYARWKRFRTGTRASLIPQACVEVDFFSDMPASFLKFTGYSICE